MQVVVLVAVTAIGGMIGLSRSNSEARPYRSTSLYVSTVDGASATTILNNFASLINSEAFRDELEVAADQELEESSLNASVPADTGLINVTVQAPTSEQVLAIADQVLPTFQQVAAETAPDIDISTALIDAFGTPPEPEVVETSQTWPVLAGMLVGLGIGILLVTFWPARRPTGVTSLQLAGDASGISFRVTVPDRRYPHDDPHVTRHDVAHALLRAGTTRWWRRPLQLLVLVPSTRNHRVFDLAVDLASVAQNRGNQALLVDADLHRGAFSHYLGMQGQAGLTDARIDGGRVLASITSVQATDASTPEIPFLAAGTHSTDASAAMIASFIHQYDEFDVAIAVASSFDEHAPLAELIEVADGVLVAGIAGETTEDELAALGDLLRSLAVTERATGALLGADRFRIELEPDEAVAVG